MIDTVIKEFAVTLGVTVRFTSPLTRRKERL
jgi:hypothetical protein